jgi:DNA-binding response OmpR family regulator
MNEKRVLIVEDDAPMARVVRDNTEFEGFAVEWSATGVDVFEIARRFSPDLVLLDVVLPNNVTGFELCRQFANERPPLPVIILTARGESEDRIRGLRLGADDYIVKPFSLEELLARVYAVLRRTKPRVQNLSLGEVAVDFARREARKGMQNLALSDREFEILHYLTERAGTVVSRSQLFRQAWGYDQAPMARVVDNFIFKLRQKIEHDPHRPKFIHTAYGGGYRLTLSAE